MAEFVALIDVVPDETDADFDALVEKLAETLPEEAVIETHEVMPVAFGLEKARVRVRYPEEWGGTDKVEECFRTLDGLQSVEGIAFSKA